MSVSAPAIEKANGLSTVLDVITSPAKAFETLRAFPMWGWAFIVSAILAVIGQYLAGPAAAHMIQATWPAQVAANPKLAAMSPAEQQKALGYAMMFVKFAPFILPVVLLVCAVIQTVIMLVFNAIGKGSASFKQLWCAAMNVFVVSFGLYNLVNGVISMVRGPQSFNTTTDMMHSIPSLAWLAPSAGLKLTVVLASVNLISIWGAVLLALAMIHVARVSRGNAIACAVVTTVLAALYFAGTAR